MHCCLAHAHTSMTCSNRNATSNVLDIYLSQFNQLLQCSCSCFWISPFALHCLHFVLLIWVCFINLLSSFLILISFSKLLAASAIQRHPQILDAFSNSIRVSAENIEFTEAEERLLNRDPT